MIHKNIFNIKLKEKFELLHIFTFYLLHIIWNNIDLIAVIKLLLA